MFPSHTVTVTTDASMIGWRGHAQGLELHSAILSRAVGPGGDVAPHQCVGALSGSFDALQYGGGFAWSGDPDRV